MDKLTPTLNDVQIKQNIDTLQKQGVANDKIQSYVNNYQKGTDGNYALKGSQATIKPTPTSDSIWSKLANGAKAVGNAVSSSEQSFGNDIAAGATAILPKSITGQDKIDEATKTHQDTIDTAIKGLHQAQASGGDTKKWLNIIGQVTGQPIATTADLYPALKKSNLQVVGDTAGTLLDILSAGSYGEVLKGASELKNAGTLANDLSKSGTLASKVVAPVAQQVADKTLGQTLKTIGTKTAIRAGEGAGTGYAYDVSQNLQNGNTGASIAKPGFGTVLGGTIPTLIGGVQAGVALTKDSAPRFINSLIKPKAADFSYGKDPGRTVSEMGITGNSLPDFANNIRTAKQDIGNQLGNIYSSEANAGIRINANDEITKIDDAIQKAAKGGKENQGIVTALQNTKDALLYEHGVDSEGNIIKMSDTPRDLSALSPQETFDLKKVVAEQTKFTGKPSDDKTINAVLKDIYGGLKEKLNSKLSVNNPEITNLNQKYADLTSAELATRNRDAIVQRSDLISTPIKFGTAGAIISAVASGGATIPIIIGGATAAGLDKALESTAVKTRIAAWLGKESPSVISKIIQNNPSVKETLYRLAPKLASQLGNTTN